jgi:hypothetical protein
LVTINDGLGRRELARASVNTSAFLPASAAIAGSGFDIFSSLSRLPDAGYFPFVRVSAPVAGNTAVVQFSIADLGDGIYDSAAIIDNLSFSFLEVVDVNPAFLNANGSIFSEPSAVAAGGRPVIGATADGVTKVLLRTRVPGAGDVEFCLTSNQAPADGGLALLGNAGRSNCVNMAAVNVNGTWMAFALYTVPENFNRGSDTNVRERTITFRARYSPVGENPIESLIPFRLTRPPIAVVHGLFGDGGSWSSFPLRNDPRFIGRIIASDYQATNSAAFAVNALVPRQAIRSALQAIRAEGFAASQVEGVGHSMGGILLRNFGNRPENIANDNLRAGYLNRIITLNTPHLGSPFGTLAPSITGNCASVAATAGFPLDTGAILDLTTGSPAINAIQASTIPNHAIIGWAAQTGNQHRQLSGAEGVLYKHILAWCLDWDAADIETFWNNQPTDGIVSVNSQGGGIAFSARTTFVGATNRHTAVVPLTAFSARIGALLDTPINSSTFGTFPAPSSLPLSVRLPAAPPPQATFVRALTITAPNDGADVTAGATVNVTVTPDAGVSDLESVLLVGAGVILEDTSAPYEFALTVPNTVVGAYNVRAFAQTPDGTTQYDSDSIRLDVTVNSALVSVDLQPEAIYLFGLNDSTQLNVAGLYADGIARNISANAGVVYSSSDNQIVTVTAAGAIQSVGFGNVTIIARSGTIFDAINVIVQPLSNQVPVANAGADQLILPNVTYTLNGAGSVDPDNAPSSLSYDWVQIDGTPVGLSAPNIPNPRFTATAAGTYLFSLIVRDGVADSTADTVAITITNPTNMVGNPSFASGMNNWGTFGDITSQVNNGVFEFARPTNSPVAVVLQNTGWAFPRNGALDASIQLGNNSAVRKRATVLLHDSDFSDLQVCTFWLPPNAPLATYRIETFAREQWDNLAISVYASTADGAGWYQLDNATLQYNLLATNRTTTRCLDPLAPTSTAGADSPEWIADGAFNAPLGDGNASWGVFGAPGSTELNMGFGITNGVLEFYRKLRDDLPAGTTNSAVVLQYTGQTVAAGTEIEAQIQLGNSHPTATQRVTVLLHARDFSDLQVCTFWLPPNTALGTYVIRTYTTLAWDTAGTDDASLSVYASTALTSGSIRVDNVSLRARPNLTIVGTECYAPAAPPAPLAESAPPLPAYIAPDMPAEQPVYIAPAPTEDTTGEGTVTE